MPDSPPIIFLTNQIENPEVLMEKLKDEVVWDERMKARMTASFGVAYNYSGIDYQDVPMPESLEPIVALIENEIGFAPNNCLLNYYPDGNSSIGFHSDTATGLAPGTGVAILSLGDTRTIVYKSKADPAVQKSFELEAGDLLYMDDVVQENWLHAVPKQAGAGGRISLSFRRIL